MEENTSHSSAPSTPTHPSGGSVEPMKRARVAKAKTQTPENSPGVRYEMRDPFTEVIYHSTRYDDMVATADQLHSIRFTAIAADGARSMVMKSGDQWRTVPAKTQQRPTPSDDQAVDAAPPAAPTQTPTPAPPVKQASPSAQTPQVDAAVERALLVARVEAALAERYVIKRAKLVAGDVSFGQTEYRFKGDLSRIAFTETTFRLATDTNSPSVARSMVDVAEARNWQALRISGSEDFRRLVWLEAAARGVKTVGYEPLPADLEMLKKVSEGRLVNRVEHSPQDFGGESAPAKASGRGGGGRKAVLVAIEAILVARGIPPARREAVLAAAAEQLAERARKGQAVTVKVLDPSAPARQSTTRKPAEPTRSRDRAAPSR